MAAGVLHTSIFLVARFKEKIVRKRDRILVLIDDVRRGKVVAELAD
jgi:hypothetical protein